VTIKVSGLKHGDRIGVIAPAGPVTPSEIRPGIQALESAGYRVVASPHLYDRQDYLAGADTARLKDLHAVIEDPEIKAVICARGGYGTLRLLEKIDYDLIRSNPKILVGYSDITALLWAVYTKTGLVTFHGPMVKDLTKNNNQNLNNLLHVISSDRFRTLNLRDGVGIKPGRARGVLLGGNLCLMTHLVGTPFMPTLKGAILFIEERGEPLYRIDRMITHLGISGHFAGLAGVIAGDFTDCGEPDAIYRILADILSDFEIPVVGGLPVGHGLKNNVLPIGAQALLDADRMTLSITEPYVHP